ncbi:MAG: DUF2125 domain-containing protein [Paracoccaceae bacterium]
MRVILWVCLALGIVWGGYWFVGSRAVDQGVVRWFADTAASGAIATNQGVSIAGFPSRFDLTVTEPHLADPATGWGWQAPFAQIFSMTWKPWHLIAALPNDQEIDAPDQKIKLHSSAMKGSLRMYPSTALTFAELVVEGHDMTATSDLGWTIAAKSLLLAIAEVPTQQNAQRLGLDATDIAPDASLTALMPDLGDKIETLHLDATLALSAPINLHFSGGGPSLQGITLRDFHGTWGKLKVTATGEITQAPEGYADGKIDFRIEDWRDVPKLLAALGVVLPGMGDSIERGFEVLAKAGPDPEVLMLSLTFHKGRMSLGPLPLGPAPMLN